MAQKPKSKDHLFKKGQSGNPKGRGKGVQNKISQDLREMIREALDKAGGVDYLLQQALENPKAFLPLVARILPQEHKVSYELGDKLVEMLNERRNQLANMRGEAIDVTPAE